MFNHWPAHVPWTLPIRTAEPTLSLEVIRYMRDLIPALYSQCQFGLRRIIDQIVDEGNRVEFISHNEYEYGFVVVAIFYEAVQTAPVTRRDMIAVLKAVKGIMSDCGSRELTARIQGDREVIGNMLIEWRVL